MKEIYHEIYSQFVQEFHITRGNGTNVLYGIGWENDLYDRKYLEDLILTTADLIESSLQEDEAVNVVIKIAKTLTDKWSEAGKRKVKPDWLTEKDNLAYYRNLPVPADKYNVILLYGSDVVTDSASLADFKHCSLKLVWENLMNRSFKSWIKEKLEDNGISIYGNAEMDKYDNILCPIIDHGRADLISISSWLEHLEIAYCEDSSEVLRLILTQLRGFKLPILIVFPTIRKTRNSATTSIRL